MSGYLSKNGYVIKKEDLSPETYQQLKHELRCRPITDDKYNFGRDISFPIYTETKTKIYIPKMYGIDLFGKTNKYLPNYIGKKWENDIPFVGELLSHQIEPIDILEKACYDKGGGILSLGTGAGKTVSCINLLSKLKTKTIIVVNKIPLLKQWEREIKQFLPNARIGFIQGQKNIKIENTDIIIAMLQSLARIDYPDDFFEDIGAVAVDECFVNNTPILTSNGNINIGTLYSNFQNNIALPMVKTFNEKTQEFEWKKILNVFRKQNDNLIEIECNEMKIKSTDNHQYLTQYGWKEAKKLNIGDLLISLKNNNINNSIITNITKNIKNIDLNHFVYDMEIQDNHNYIISKNNCGFIVHNCHNTSSKVFSNVLKKLCCKYTIGLSATPKRSDGCEYVFKWHLGDIVYSSNTLRQGLPPIIKLVKLKSDEYKEITTTNPMTGQNQIQFTSMLTELVQMQKRNKYILDTIINCVNEKRTVLLMSDRRTHLQLIYNMLQEQTVSFTYGLFLGQMKSKDLDKSMSCQVILATYSAFSEGVSKKDLNTLILITPKKYIGHLKNTSKNESGKMEQIVGRIFRKEHLEIHPMIIDLCDDFSVYKNQSSQRKAFYKSHFKNYQLCKATVDLNVESDKIQEIIEDTPTKNINSHHQNDEIQAMQNLCLIDD